MEITKLSTKGQIVIPEEIRKGLEVGTPFVVVKQGNLILLKKVENFSKKELVEIRELDKIWEEVDKGKCESYAEEDFFKKMKEW
jgi:AbrB family looped-hinge helix DNA binding protein